MCLAANSTFAKVMQCPSERATICNACRTAVGKGKKAVRKKKITLKKTHTLHRSVASRRLLDAAQTATLFYSLDPLCEGAFPPAAQATLQGYVPQNRVRLQCNVCVSTLRTCFANPGGAFSCANHVRPELVVCINTSTRGRA